LALLFPLAMLALVEGALRLGGYGHSTRFFESHEDGVSLCTNPQFAWSFYSRETSTAPTPMKISVGKTPGTFRIFVLGESAAAGTPDPAYSFSRILALMLQRQYPSNRFEVINAAMRGINSHIVRHIARECAALSPDLFIVYMGNNELIGLHAPAPDGFNFTAHLRLLRLGDAIKATRLAQLVGAFIRGVGKKAERKMQDMEYLRGQRLALVNPRRQSAYENFQVNLEDICEVAERTGAQTVLASVGVNLRDFPPLGSLHRPNLTSASPADFEQTYSQGVAAESRRQTNEALAQFEMAVRLDPHFAELHFRAARCYEAAGKLDLARQHYSLARDWDALQFRADSRINETIRLAAERRRSRGVLFADAAAAFATGPLAENGVPGRRLFNDHVHLTFDGDYQLARVLLNSVGTALRLGPGSATPPTRDECANALAFTPVDEMNVLAAMAQQTSKPPFLDQLEHAQRQAESDGRVRDRLSRTTMADFEQAATVYRATIARHPDDWMLHYNFGNLFSQFGQHTNAAAEYEFVVKRLPRQRMFRLNLGNALLQSGRPADALAQYRAALEIDPDFAPAKEAIASAHRRAR
jgi:tetratricopeptide (TPR) repeat protein